ncbi:MAG TPA: nucleotide exchange factor GrpE, partial [Gemmataceae bacterium]
MSEHEEQTPGTPAEAQPPPAPEVEELRQRAEQAERERDECVNLLKAKQAEFENYQKRAARDREQERAYAAAPLAAELLPVLDNLERALDAARQAGDDGPLAQGVQATYAQMLDVLRRFGVNRIEAQGRPFDPHLHEAVAQQPSADLPPQSVLQVYRQGYTIHDRVLRPASVVVSAAPPADGDEPS